MQFERTNSTCSLALLYSFIRLFSLYAITQISLFFYASFIIVKRIRVYALYKQTQKARQ